MNNTNEIDRAGVLSQLQYIADSPEPEHGGFHPEAVKAAKDAIQYISQSGTAIDYESEANELILGIAEETMSIKDVRDWLRAFAEKVRKQG